MPGGNDAPPYHFDRSMTAPGTSEPTVASFTLVAEDGFPLAARRHVARGARQGVLLVAPATGTTQGGYRAFAEAATAAGWDVLTWDWRGTGASRHALPWRDRRLRLRAWGALDLAAAIDWADRRAPAERIVLVGHGVGGQLVGLAPNAGRLGALVLVAAGDGWVGHLASPWCRLRHRLLWGLAVPVAARLLGRVPAAWLRLEEDLPCEVVLEWARWCRNPAAHGDWDGHAALRLPVLAYSFADDPISPHTAVAALLRRFTSASRLTHRRLTPGDLGQVDIGHHGFFRETGTASQWAEVFGFLSMQLEVTS